MSGAFNRDALPGWQSYAGDFGLVLHGRGKWRNLLCDFHADTEPSLRVNMQSNGWCCMACGAKGGDTLSHYMQRTAASFVEAAKALGAWDATKASGPAGKPRSLSASDAMQVLAPELLLCVAVISDIRRGVIPTDADWQRFLVAASRIEALAMEFRQ